MKKIFALVLTLFLGLQFSFAQTDVTSKFLTHYSFDGDYDYTSGQTTAVAQEILSIPGWTQGFTHNYTITGVYEFGFAGTFNGAKVPAKGYDGEAGGGLALSTGWSCEFPYTQQVCLPAGTYTINVPTYNGCSVTAATSMLAWIPESGDAVTSSTASYAANAWTLDQITFTLTETTKGKIRIGMKAASGGSANSAKLVIDYVQLMGSDMASYSESSPLDYTGFITNPSFESGMQKGWTNSGFSLQSNDSFTSKAGTYYAERWRAAGAGIYDSNIMQTINLPNGKYVLTVAAQNLNQNDTSEQCTGATIFADEQITPVYTAADYTVNFNSIMGEATVGYKTESATGNWIAVDNFRLYRVGDLTTTEMIAELQTMVTSAQSLTSEKMYSGTASSLSAAITAASALTSSSTEAEIQQAALTLYTQKLAATISIAAYASLQAVITSANSVYDALLEGASDLLSVINEVQTAYDNASATDDETAALQTDLEKAVLSFHIANATEGTGTAPSVTSTNHYVVTGASEALMRAEFSGDNILEKGVCWSTSHNPTVTDERTTSYYTLNGKMYHLTGLSPMTVYYLRPYVMNNTYTVAYGDEVKIVTRKVGTCKYTWNEGAPNAAANDRCRTALKETVNYLNAWTGIQNFTLSATYGSGTATADCSYGGSMRIGPNSAYQAIGTVLHETGHGVGVGTHWRWYSCADTRANTTSGKWLGREANEVLYFLENKYNDDGLFMTGDKTHGWGSTATYDWFVNGADKDKHTALQYIGCCALLTGLYVDGLCPTSSDHNGIPSYCFNFDDSKKYYLTSKSSDCGLGTGLLYMDGSTPKWKTYDTSSTPSDAAAWYLEYDASTGLYKFKNASTGTYLTSSSNSAFQLMPDRTDATVGEDPYDFTTHGYWLTWYNSENKALTAASDGSVSTATFNYATAAATQHWVILSEDELTLMQTAVREGKTEWTDISNKLINYNFDIENDYQTANVTTGTSHHYNPTGWTTSSTNANGASAVMQIGSSYTLNGQSVPATNVEGAAEGGALGISEGWGVTNQYSQTITLPAGVYRYSYAVQNMANATTTVTNLCGYKIDGNDAVYDSECTTFAVDGWHERVMHSFTLTESTPVTFYLGLTPASQTSTTNPYLYFDYVRLECHTMTIEVDETDIIKDAVCEDSKMTYWTGSSGRSCTTTTGWSGNSELVWTQTSTSTQYPRNQVVTLPKAGTYLLRAAVRVTNKDHFVKIRIYKGSTINAASQTGELTASTSGVTTSTIATDGTEWDSAEKATAAGKTLNTNGWTYLKLYYTAETDNEQVVVGATMSWSSNSVYLGNFQLSYMYPYESVELPSGYYRIKSANGSRTDTHNYLQNTTSGSGIALGDGTTAGSIYYVSAKGTLLNYDTGKYLNDYGALKEAGTAPLSWFIFPNEDVDGAYALQCQDKTTVLSDKADATVAVGASLDNQAAWTLESVNQLPVTIGATGYTTFAAPVDLTVPSALNLYNATENLSGGIKITEESNGYEANTGVILHGAQGTYNLTIADNDADYTSVLTPVIVATHVKGGTSPDYVLANGLKGIGFYNIDSSVESLTISGHKAYLASGTAVTSETKEFIPLWGDEETDIEAVQGSASEVQGEVTVYNLSGQRLNHLQRGINIVNGKKIIRR